MSGSPRSPKTASAGSLVKRKPRLPVRATKTLGEGAPTKRPPVDAERRFREFRRSSSLPGIFDISRPGEERASSAAARQTRNYHLECERQGIVPAKRELVAQNLMGMASSTCCSFNGSTGGYGGQPQRHGFNCTAPGAVSLPSVLVGDRHVIAWCNSGMMDGRTELRMHDAQLGDPGLTAIAARLNDSTETLNITGNAFGVLGCEALAKAHMRQLETLVLSGNNLSDMACMKLFVGLSAEGSPQLVRLTMANNQISYGARAIGNWLPTQRRISLIDVHWNYISGDGALGLFKGLTDNIYGCLARLDISWNCLANVGAAASIAVLSKALSRDCPLLHLDLSYNGLQPAECEILGKGLRSNHCLLGLHLVGNAAEVDANGFVTAKPNALAQLYSGAGPTYPAQLIGERSLVGAKPPRHLSTEEQESIRAVFDDIDTDGSGSIDAEEFQVAMKSMGMDKSIEEIDALMRRNDANGDGVIDIDEFTALMSELILKEQQKDWHQQRHDTLELQRDRSALEARTRCWICESWREVEFTWHGQAKAVWIYTSADGYRHPARMVEKAKGQYSCYRMLPPEEVCVIFQVDDDLALMPSLPTVALSEPATLKLRGPEGQALKGDGAFRTIEEASLMSKHLTSEEEAKCGVCSPCSPSNSCRKAVVVLDDPSNPKGFRVVPRKIELEKDTDKPPPTNWTFEKSLFNRWEAPSQKVYESCFDSDWPHVKFRRFMKSEDHIEQAQSALKRHYTDFLLLYRRYAALSPSGASPFGVAMKPAHDLLGLANISSATVCHAGEVETIFIAARVVEHRADKRPFVVKPGDTLLRFQFLEMLLRTAIVRYYQTQECSTVNEAITTIFAALTPIATAASKERNEFMKEFQVEASDSVLRSHQEMLDTLYRNYCGLNKGMSRKQFEDLVASASMDRKKCGSKEVTYAYLLGSQVYPDELYDMDFAHLSSIEFYYAVGAIAFFMPRIDEEETLAQRMDAFIKGLSQGRVKNLLRILK